jgi:hypothetical protein
MKRLFGVMVLVSACGWARAGYDFVIDGGYGVPDLHGYQTLLMTGGGSGGLYMTDHSSARIEGTSPLEEGAGGIWNLDLGGESHLDFLGGEVRSMDFATYATAVLSGGRIDQIRSRQNAWKYVDGPPVHLVPNPHITIVCDLDSVVHNPQTNILTGTWLDGMAFSIQLIDVEGYSPAIENIQFIPEPSTLLLMALGVVSFLHRR